MIKIRYNPAIIDGQDKSGKTEIVTDEIAHRLVKLGHASIVEEMAVMQPGETRGFDVSTGGTSTGSVNGRINPEDIPFDNELSIFKKKPKKKKGK